MKRRIAVIFGGRSVEHDVSIITAHLPIISSLQASGQFDVWPVYIAKDGRWYCDQLFNEMTVFQRPDFTSLLTKQRQVGLSLDGGLKFVWPGLRPRTVAIDIVFPSMHGTFGEDGSLMGLLRMADVPFVGCDMAASAVAMDKALTKQVLAAEGVPVVPFVWFTASQWSSEREAFRRRIEKLDWPLFVKPVHLGSSIGMAKVKTPAALDQAVEVALHYDDKILVEEGIEDLIEITLPIIGNNEVRLAELERPLNKTEFFNFDDKYLSGAKKGGAAKDGANSQYSEIPAAIDEGLARQVKELGVKTYLTLGCSGIARVDFLIDRAGRRVYVNEVNTLPGSLYHHNWRKAGLSNMDLVMTLIRLADERFQRQQQATYTFSSDILSKYGGTKTSS